MKQRFQIHSMPLVVEDGSTVTLSYVQQHGGYRVLDVTTTESEMVTSSGVVMTQDSLLVSCADYVQLAIPYSEVIHGSYVTV